VHKLTTSDRNRQFGEEAKIAQCRRKAKGNAKSKQTAAVIWSNGRRRLSAVNFNKFSIISGGYKSEIANVRLVIIVIIIIIVIVVIMY
jgi:hypothetical protein